MKFLQTKIQGVYEIVLEPRQDERGFFARTYCKDEFAAQGLNIDFVQENSSLSHARGTLRGMHYQLAPYAEDKFISCASGELFDVALDMRPDSPTYLNWQGFHLSAANRNKVFIPKGVAHGFQTLMDDTEIRYLVSNPYYPKAERGVRWNDPVVGIQWPLEPTVLSDKDKSWSDLKVS